MPPTGNEVRTAPFAGVLWVFFLLITFYLFGWPPLEGMIAKYRWREVPCYFASADATQYYFLFNGVKYVSSRTNIWMVQFASPVTATQGTPVLSPNTSCFVRSDSAGNAGMAVLRPIGPPTADQLFSRLAIEAMVLVAILMMISRIKKNAALYAVRAAEESPDTSSPASRNPQAP